MQDDTAPANAEEYHEHYKSFDAMPFAFTDIEMVFDEERRAVDWIFRYANPALAKLEKLPLESLIDHSFGSLFANMDAGGCAAMSAPFCTAKCWKFSITARRWTPT